MTETTGIRIATWSGPRNISTALMRSWDSRSDTVVCDEPFYAHFLKTTGRDHPGRQEVLVHHEADWKKVAAWLTGPIPDGKTVFYQKHMAHHFLPNMDGDWLDALSHVFLIRDPREMLTSLVKVIPHPTLEDTGLPQQRALFERLGKQQVGPPPVLDARDVLENPRAMLAALCQRLEVPFQDAMLAWKPGRRPTDGVWAKYWYASVERSTGFHAYQPKPDVVPSHLEDVYAEAQTLYEKLYAYRLQIEK